MHPLRGQGVEALSKPKLVTKLESMDLREKIVTSKGLILIALAQELAEIKVVKYFLNEMIEGDFESLLGQEIRFKIGFSAKNGDGERELDMKAETTDLDLSSQSWVMEELSYSANGSSQCDCKGWISQDLESLRED